jgi:hypothetical protein
MKSSLFGEVFSQHAAPSPSTTAFNRMKPQEEEKTLIFDFSPLFLPSQPEIFN